jgi:hypothetical protein
MASKALEIKTATIEIKVVRVDGHKMTKATFRQIQHDTTSEVSIESILGWVSDDGVFIIWGDDGKVFRRRVGGWNMVAHDLKGRRIDRSEYDDYVKRHADLLAFVKNNCDQLFIAT